MTTDRLDNLIASAAPVGDRTLAAAAPPETYAGLARALAFAEEARAARPRRRRLGRRSLVLAAAAVALVSAATGFAQVLTTRTGWFGNPAYSEEDGTEWLRTNAPDFRQVAGGLVPDVELPPGAGWKTELHRLATQGRANPALVQETGVRATLESYARCAWLESWRSAYLSGDAPASRRATIALTASAGWPATVATDGGGVRDRIRAVARSARRNDAGAVANELSLNCDGFDLGGVR